MQGLCDPFNRAPLQMCDTQMLQWYAKLSALRHAHPALQRGEIAVFAPAGDVVCILRIITGGTTPSALRPGMRRCCWPSTVRRTRYAAMWNSPAQAPA